MDRGCCACVRGPCHSWHMDSSGRLTDLALIELAQRIAIEAHEGQTDKAGKPYWTHPARVAANVRKLYPDAPDEAVAAAWLHDVIEDTWWTAEKLADQGIPPTVVDTVVALTRLDDGTAPDGYDYYDGIVAAGPIAVMVKHADITDNLNEDRLALLDSETVARLRKKYSTALKRLSLD